MDGGDLWTLMTLPHKVERLVCATDRALESKLVAEIILHATALTTAQKASPPDLRLSVVKK